MKYELETIPVWDAVNADTECALCLLEQKIEKGLVDFFLGGSVMEPDIRGMVNSLGFCQSHFEMLFRAGNKLGVALMTHTRLLHLIKHFRKPVEKKVKKNREENPDTAAQDTTGCVLCYKLGNTLKRYTFTVVYLWDKDPDFRTRLAVSKGFCMPHYRGCIEMASEILSGKKKEQCIDDLFTVQEKNLARLEEEILWFTQKFDYRNNDKPWNNSKDSLQRTIQKISGKILE